MDYGLTPGIVDDEIYLGKRDDDASSTPDIYQGQEINWTMPSKDLSKQNNPEIKKAKNSQFSALSKLKSKSGAGRKIRDPNLEINLLLKIETYAKKNSKTFVLI